MVKFSCGSVHKMAGGFLMCWKEPYLPSQKPDELTNCVINSNLNLA